MTDKLSTWMQRDASAFDVEKYEVDINHLRQLIAAPVHSWAFANTEMTDDGLCFTGGADTDPYDGYCHVERLPLVVMYELLTSSERIAFATAYQSYYKMQRKSFEQQQDGWNTFSKAIHFGDIK